MACLSEQLDQFNDCCSDISIVGENMTTIAKTSDNGWASIYGSLWIKLNENKRIIKYNVKINKLSNPCDGLMHIGISSNDNHSNGRYSFYNDNKNYSFRSDGVIYHNSKYFDVINHEYKANDIITLEIDPFKKQISFYKNHELVNSQQYNTSSNNCYKFAVSLFTKHDSVSIINRDDIVVRRSNLNEQTKFDHKSEASVDILEELVYNNDLLTSEIEILRQQLSSIKQINRELQFENASLKKQNKSLSNHVSNEKNYVNWNVSQVVSWIMSIEDGKYLKYFDMLNIRMNEYNLNGKQLQKLDYVDIKQLGIIDVDDRKLLYRNIQLLIAENKKYSKSDIEDKMASKFKNK